MLSQWTITTNFQESENPSAERKLFKSFFKAGYKGKCRFLEDRPRFDVR